MNVLPFKLEKRYNLETKYILDYLWLNGHINIVRLFSDFEIKTIKKKFQIKSYGSSFKFFKGFFYIINKVRKSLRYFFNYVKK